MTKGSSLILRIYFGVVSAVTLFTLMWGAIDFLTIGLKTYIFTAADVPAYGIINCDDPNAVNSYYPTPTKPDGTIDTSLSEEEKKARCEASNTTAMEQYGREKANSAVRNLALILVSLPLFVVHFRTVYHDWKDDRKA